MAVMEGYSPTARLRRPPAGADRLPARRRSAPIRRHEKLDIKHKRELYETIDALPLTAEHERIMGMSGLHTMQAAVDVFAEIQVAATRGLSRREAGMTAPLKLREFRLLFPAQVASNIGDWLDYLALAVLIAYVWEDGPGALAALAVVLAVPWIVRRAVLAACSSTAGRRRRC